MKKNNNFSIHCRFYLHKGKLKKCAVMIEIFINRKPRHRSTNFAALPSEWDHESGQYKDNAEANSELKAISDLVQKTHKDYLKLKRPISHEQLFKIIRERTKKDINPKTLFGFALRVAQDRSVSLSGSSIRKENNQIDRLEKFLRHTRQTEILLCEVKPAFLQQYYQYCIQDACKHNHSVLQVRYVKLIMKQAHFEGLIDRNNVEFDFRFKVKEASNYTFLSAEELEIFSKYHYPRTLVQSVADMFVFQCYTSFDYGDLYEFNPKIHVQYEQETAVIRKIRCKNDEVMLVPFFEEAKAIWEKYEGKFPIISNQVYNKYLKEIGKLLGFEKNMNSKVGRKTFGNIMYGKNISLDVVKTMMGHKSIRTTEKYYVQTMQIHRVLHETQNLSTVKKA